MQQVSNFVQPTQPAVQRGAQEDESQHADGNGRRHQPEVQSQKWHRLLPVEERVR